MDKQVKKDEITREDILKKIIESLGKDGVVSRTVLIGESGIGKTWLAQKASYLMKQETSSCVLWLHLNKKITNEKSLYENLASQFSLFHEYEEGEEHVNDSVDTLKDKIAQEIINQKKKNLVLILDDEGSMTNEEFIMKDLKLQEFLEVYSALKTLIIKRDSKEEEDESTIKVTPLTEEESQNLLQSSNDFFKSLTIEDWPNLLQKLYENKEIKNPNLISCVARKSKGLPAAIIVLNKSLKSIKSLSEKQKKIFKELILTSESLDSAAASKNAIIRSQYNPVLRLIYELLKPDQETIQSPIIACFWHVLDFYKHCGCGYYRDLIVHWMLEGYFDPVKSVKKAYLEGHSILMEFMNRGILKIQEDNMLVPEMSLNNLLDLQDCGFFGRSRLGFNRVYNGDKTKGLGRIILIDDMITTIQSKDKKKIIKTIIVSGNRLRREVSNKFFEKPETQDLEIVVLFEPNFQHLVESLSRLKKLRVLVIRNCDHQINNIDSLHVLENLQVLEVSGSTSLDNISNDFFGNMIHLQSLNLSGLLIKSPPSSIENLSKLRCFILRDCSELQDLPNFNVSTSSLEVIDIKGARKLESYFDKVKDWKDYKGKNKNFAHLQNLEYLDFSETRIIRLPIFHLKNSDKDYSTMPSLTRLLLKNCTRLKRLPQLAPLINLQILDLSCATSLVEMFEVCLEKKDELRVLDLSETSLPELADTINGVTNLNQLLIRNCLKISEIPSIEKLINLEVFDVSGCNQLMKIDGSFEKLSFLRKVNLSETNLCELPNKITELSNLKELLVRNCIKLKSIPNLEKLINLEIFDVSGCIELSEIDGSFEKMSYLREVNLSKTLLKSVPELPKQSMLCFSKRIVLMDSRSFERDEWSQIKKCLEMNIKEESSFSNSMDKSENLVRYSDRYRVLDPDVPADIGIFNICKSKDLKTEDIAKTEYVSISENESTSLSSILDEFQMRSVKGCWIERCKNIENLFIAKGNQEEKEKSSEFLSLESLWISNLPLLKSLSNSNGGFNFKNLKNLSIDCCPRIKFLFPEFPDNLEILCVKFCDNLERLFEEDEVGKLSKLRKLYLLDLPVLSIFGAKFSRYIRFKIEKCPNLKPIELYRGLEQE